MSGFGFKAVGELHRGDQVLLLSGETRNIEKVTIEPLKDTIKVYNFEVEDWHTYFVSDQGVLVHNMCQANPPIKGNKSGKGGSGTTEYVDLTDFRKDHILNNHKYGVGKPDKTEFPQSWSDDKILHYVSDVATDPNATWGWKMEFTICYWG